MDQIEHAVEVGVINSQWVASCSCGVLSWHHDQIDAVQDGINHLSRIECMKNHPSANRRAPVANPPDT